MTHPADLSVAEAGEALRSGWLLAADLTRAHLDRIAALNPSVRAFVHLAEDRAIAAAEKADAELASGEDRGPLHGIPFAIKDVFDVEGMPVIYGSRLHRGRIAPATAPVVQRLLDAGAVPLGIVATYDLGIVGPGSDGAYPPAVNPWNPAHITGGSSSGAAAAVAAGMVRIALGSDTGGSVRSPAAYCGVVGLKPAYGSTPTAGALGLAPSLDHLGSVARSVGDAMLMLDAMTGRRTELRAGIEGLRIGYARSWFADDPATHSDVTLAMDAAVSDLSLCGAATPMTDLPDYALMEAAAAVLIHGEGLETHREALRGDGGAMGRMPYQSMIAGVTLTGGDLANAHEAARRLRAEIDAALATVDAVVMPTVLAPAPPFSAFEANEAVWTAMRTIPFNMTGHPALSVPMGFSGGLPLGMQIVGRDESTICRIGAAYEMATDHSAQRPYFA
ncbi:MAG: amidase [Paracoccaceae bacterium]